MTLTVASLHVYPVKGLKGIDLAESRAHELGETIEVVGLVLLPGEEPAVARRPAVAVAKAVECGVDLGPCLHPAGRDVVRRCAPMRLVVVAEREQNVSRLCRV